jgi:hypothetical protein
MTGSDRPVYPATHQFATCPCGLNRRVEVIVLFRISPARRQICGFFWVGVHHSNCPSCRIVRYDCCHRRRITQSERFAHGARDEITCDLEIERHRPSLLVSMSRTHYKTFGAWLNHLTAWLGETVPGCRAHPPGQSDRGGIERGRSRRQSHCNENF